MTSLSFGSTRQRGLHCLPFPLLMETKVSNKHKVEYIISQHSRWRHFWLAGRCVGVCWVVLTVTTLPQIMRLRLFVKQLTRSTKAGRLLGGPVSTRHWGLEGEEGQGETLCGNYLHLMVESCTASKRIVRSRAALCQTTTFHEYGAYFTCPEQLWLYSYYDCVTGYCSWWEDAYSMICTQCVYKRGRSKSSFSDRVSSQEGKKLLPRSVRHSETKGSKHSS